MEAQAWKEAQAMTETYRIIQDGITVARTEGPNSLRDIMQQARFYAQDKPLAIQRKDGRRWREYGRIAVSETPLHVIQPIL